MADSVPSRSHGQPAHQSDRLRRRLAVAFAIAGLLSSPVLALPNIALAASPQPTTAPPPVKGTPGRTDGASVRSATAVPITLAAAGGRGGTGGSAVSAGQVDVALSPRTPKVVPPKVATDVPALATERSRTVANPDGTYTFTASGSRQNYQDAAGAWQPIDLSLVSDALGSYAFRVKGNDRAVRLGAGSADAALARLTSAGETVAVRALDFPSVLTAGGPASVASQTPSPSQAPTETATPAPTDAAATAPPSASQNAAVSVSPGPSASAAASPTASSATPGPTVAPSAAPSSSGSASPPAIYPDNELRFTKDAQSGQVTVQPTVDGVDFGALLTSADQATTYAFALDLGDLTAAVGDDGQSIILSRTVHGEGKDELLSVGLVSAPAIRDANEVPAPTGAITVQLYRPGTDLVAPLAVSAAALSTLGPTEIVVVYTVDPTYLAAPGRLFPLTLDPTVCIASGVSGCTTGSIDHFVESNLPDSYPSGWTVFRVGYDVRTDDGAVYNTMRGLVYFPDVALPDGAVVSGADLKLHESSVYGGGSGNTIQALRITDKDGWATTETWHKFGTGSGTSGDGNGYVAAGLASATSGAAGTDMHWAVDSIVQSWYTRRGQDWTGDQGFTIKMVSDASSSSGEVEFSRYNDASPAKHPTLTITYDVPKVGIDFDPALGPNYAPSTLLAGQATTLPIVVTNKGSGFDFTTAGYKVGYRWFDEKNAFVGSGVQALPSCVGTGSGCTPTVAVSLSVTPPATTGSYTLRLELVRHGTNDVFASDYATPSLYYSRNKKVLTSDNTRWTGSSLAIERDEFSVAVVAAGGTAGTTQTVGTGDGGQLALELHTRDLTYSGSGGVGFRDLLPVELRYGYDASLGSDCSGVLAACGWWTNWDERLIPASTSGHFTYQDPTGHRSLVDTDADGQLNSGADVLLSRPRVTIWDEAGTSTATLVAASGEGFSAFSGLNVLKAPSNNSTTATPTGFAPIELDTYPVAKFAVRTTSAARAGLGFKIHNVTDPTNHPDRWFFYTVGSSDWTSGQAQAYLGGSIAGAWSGLYSDNLWSRVKSDAGFGAPTDSYQIISMQLPSSSSGNTGSTYLDAFRLEPVVTTPIADANPAWTSAASGTGTTTDAVVGAASVYVPSNPLASSPDCLDTGCTTTTDLGVYPFVHWSWKKLGGGTAAVVFHIKDTRTGAPCSATVCELVYYAGPTAPSSVTKIYPIQVSAGVPVGWTKVTRNVLEDARQAMNLFNDNAGATSPGAPPTQGPTADAVQSTGFKVSGVDGVRLSIDDLTYASVPDPAIDELGHPTATTDSTFTYDFTATYPDGTIHYFNQYGLLARVADRDGNTISLDWTITLGIAGQAAYALTTMHAPTDGQAGGGTTFRRQLGIARTGSGPRTVTVTENLGTAANPVTGRSTGFSIATTDDPGGTFTIGDVVTIKPARQPTCAGSAPTGCLGLTYTSADAHQLFELADPRWDGSTSGPTDDRFEVTWTAGAPMAILDRSHHSAPLLRVLSYSSGSAAPASSRVVWQDAAAARASAVIDTDLIADGRTLAEYIPLACSPASDCTQSANWPAPSTAKRRTAMQFDGLARINTTIDYRCPGVAMTGSGCTGTTAEAVVRRQATKAGAKVDTYSDPLVAAELAWTQSPDQYLSSLTDSAGADPDLYRTAYSYDEYGRQTAISTPVWDARPDYRRAITSTTQSGSALKGYWRLNEGAGATTAADLAAPAHAATYLNFASAETGQGGPLLNDGATKAPHFDGVNHYLAIPSLGSLSGSFTAEAWIKPAATSTTMSFLGSRKSNTGTTDYTFDLKVLVSNGTPSLYADIGDGNQWLLTGLAAQIPSYVANRWYDVAIVVDAPAQAATLYLNGAPIGRSAFATTGTPLLTDATRVVKIGNNGRDSITPEWWSGGLGEVALWSQALTGNQIADHAAAGRSIALESIGTSYDAEWHKTQADDQSLASPGFESGTADWDFGSGNGGQVISAASVGDPRVHSGLSSYSTNLTGNVQQDVNLVPGQTARVQVWNNRSSSTVTSRINLYYWQRSSASWVALVNVNANGTAGVWTSWAWDVVLPFDTDGRVRIALWVQNAAGSDTVYYDDAAILTQYGRTAYNANGTIDSTDTFSPFSLGGGGTIGEVKAQAEYAADTAASGTTPHPAIWPTTTIANDVGAGVYDPAHPDQNVTSTLTYDGWGRPLVAADADGVATTNTYNASAGTNGFLTDLTSTADGLGEATTMAYDRVGNQTLSTTPKSEPTTTACDLLNHATTITAPNSIVSVAIYDDYGFKLADIANNVDGNGSGPTGVDDVAAAYTYDAMGNSTKVETDCGQTTPTISCTANGGLDGTTTTTYDLLGNAVATTRYPGAAGSGTAGITTAYFETAQYDLGDGLGLRYFSRPRPSAGRGPISPPTGAPTCPDTTASVACTTAAVMPGASGGTVSGVDPTARTVGVTGPYGAVARTFFDLEGRAVFSIANYADGVFDPTVPDTDLVTTTQYHISGQAEVVIGVRRYPTDTADPRTVSAFDQLGRVLSVTAYDTTGAAINVAKTVYTAAGRVDRTARPDGTAVADASRTWTKTVYDQAGRAIKTLDHFDINGAAGLVIDSFEQLDPTKDVTIVNDGIAQRWDKAAGVFVAAGAAASVNHSSSNAKTGSSVLAVTTGTGSTTGVEWKLDGTYLHGRTYQASIWANVPSGTTLTVQLGVASDQASQTLAGNGAWQRLPTAVSWTPGADRSGVVLAVYRSGAGGAVSFDLDDAVVWDSATADLDVPTSETVYDSDGHITASIAPPGAPGSDEPLVTRTARDVLGRVTSVTANEIAGASGDQTSNLVSQTHYDALGRTDFTLDPLGHKTSFAYDRLGHSTATIQNDTGVAPAAATDDHGVTSTFAADVLGQPIGYCPAQQVFLTGCDPTSASNSQAWHWTYDPAGDQTSQVPPVNQTQAVLATRHWAYDGGGRLITVTDDHANGSVTDRHTDTPASAYDAVGRLLVSKTYIGAGTGTPALQSTMTYLGTGQLSAIAYAEAGTNLDTIAETYDPAGRPNLVQRVATPSNVTLAAFGWNADGTLGTRADGDAGVVGTTTFTYDWAKRLSVTSLPAGWQTGANTAALTYRPDGLIASRTWNGGTPASFAYDAAKRVTGLTLGSLASFGQTYDRAGNVTTESRSLSLIGGDPGTGAQTFAYDGLNRVTAQTGLAADSATTPGFTYDQDGNRLQKIDGPTTFTYHYDRTDEPTDVTKTGGSLQTFAYSNTGDLLTDPESGTTATTYAYDIGGKLTSITPAAGSATTFTYDALGRPKTRVVPAGGTDTYSYIGATKAVVRIANSGGTTTDSIVDVAGDRLGTRQVATVNWSVPDLHGSIAASLDQALGQILSATRYDAYGQVLATGGPGGTGTGFWKYQGRLDVSPGGTNNTTLYAAGARFYAPGLGQFTALDTVSGSAQNPMSMNRFLYAEANPTTLIDPTGHFVSANDSTPGSRCSNIGDWGCGQTAPTSKSNVRPAAPQPSGSNHQYHANGRGATWRDQGGASPPTSTIPTTTTYGPGGPPSVPVGPGPFSSSPLDVLARAGVVVVAATGLVCVAGLVTGPGDIGICGGTLSVEAAVTVSAGAGELAAAESTTAAEVAPNIIANAARGAAFESQVLQALRVAGNSLNIVTNIGNRVRPDSIAHGILEIKDKINITSTAQLRGEFDLAINTFKLPFNLVVSMNNQSISQSVQDMVQRSGGTIVRFDPSTGSFLPWP